MRRISSKPRRTSRLLLRRRHRSYLRPERRALYEIAQVISTFAPRSSGVGALIGRGLREITPKFRNPSAVDVLSQFVNFVSRTLSPGFLQRLRVLFCFFERLFSVEEIPTPEKWACIFDALTLFCFRLCQSKFYIRRIFISATDATAGSIRRGRLTRGSTTSGNL